MRGAPVPKIFWRVVGLLPRFSAEEATPSPRLEAVIVSRDRGDAPQLPFALLIGRVNLAAGDSYGNLPR